MDASMNFHLQARLDFANEDHVELCGGIRTREPTLDRERTARALAIN
jgi:hypothetical protein